MAYSQENFSPNVSEGTCKELHISLSRRYFIGGHLMTRRGQRKTFRISVEKKGHYSRSRIHKEGFALSRMGGGQMGGGGGGAAAVVRWAEVEGRFEPGKENGTWRVLRQKKSGRPCGKSPSRTILQKQYPFSEGREDRQQVITMLKRRIG